MRELVIEAIVENATVVIDFVTGELKDLDCSERAIIQTSIAIDEIFSNIANYAYRPEVGCATVRTEILNDPTRVVITFLDEGTPFDPFSIPDCDINAPLEERGIGGLGIHLVKMNMDEVKYDFVDGQNVLTICKHLQ